MSLQRERRSLQQLALSVASLNLTPPQGGNNGIYPVLLPALLRGRCQEKQSTIALLLVTSAKHRGNSIVRIRIGAGFR